jgi:hypothetical protein
LKLDIKPNCKGSVEITDELLLEAISEVYGEPVLGINIHFVAEIHFTPGRIMTPDPADSYPDEYDDERRVTSIELSLQGSTSAAYYGRYLDNEKDAVLFEQIELACEDEIYSAEVA